MKDWQNEKDQPHHDPTARVVRAAEYVRMSTDHQKYSTENQADAIRHYTSSRGIEIVSTYADDGKSGLSIDGRASLQRLIADVESGAADFEMSNGAQTGPRIGVEEGPPFRD